MNLAPTEYAKNFQVYPYEADCYGMATPGSILRYAQQAATENSEAMGLNDEVYARTGTAYVLAKQAIHFERVPQANEMLTVLTQPENAKRAANKRLTRVFDADGRQVAMLDGRWVLIDTEKRTILRTHPAEFELWSNEVEGELPMRMHKARGEQLDPVGEYTAAYTQCDKNGHMNNTRYADVICDALPWAVWQACTVQDMLIFYHKEIPKGERFTLYCGKTDELQWYFSGVSGDKTCFEASITMCRRGC